MSNALHDFFDVLLRIGKSKGFEIEGKIGINDAIEKIIEETKFDRQYVYLQLRKIEDLGVIEWQRSKGRGSANRVIILQREMPEEKIVIKEFSPPATARPAAPAITVTDVEAIVARVVGCVSDAKISLQQSIALAVAKLSEKVSGGQNEQVEAETPTPKKVRLDVVLLVDFDNVLSHAENERMRFSFRKLKEYARTFGNIVFSDVFLPVRSSAEKTVAKLWEAGYQVVICPMAYKDKDAVDAKINWRARQYLSMSSVDTVMIASRDADFKDLLDFARDQHKKVTFIDILQKRELFEGEDVEIEVVHSRETAEFVEVIARVERNELEYLRNGQRLRLDYLGDIICEMIGLDASRQWTFRIMQQELFTRLNGKWNKVFSIDHLTRALSAMIDVNMIIKNQGIRIVFYTLNLEHPVVKRIIDAFEKMQR